MKWKKGKPKESGKYVCLMNYGEIETYNYSSKHKMFNCQDRFTKKYAKKVGITDVVTWIKLEDFLKEVEYE